MTGSFVLWYEPKNESNGDNVTLEVHVNLFKDEKKKKLRIGKSNYVFDFGFMIDSIENIKSINLVVPFQIQDTPSDLGNIIASNNELLAALFNESYSANEDSKAKQFEIQDKQSKKIHFMLYEFSDAQITYKSQSDDATMLTLDTSEIIVNPQVKKYYFRIRVKTKGRIGIIDDKIYEKSIFNYICESTEIIDFRLNDLRSTSADIVEKFQRGFHFRIEKIHYLLLRDACDIIISNGSEVKSRLLEPEVWGKYFNHKINKKLIAYHIKEKSEANEGIPSFSSLIRFQNKNETVKTIIKYAIALLVSGVISGIISSLIVDIFFI